MSEKRLSLASRGQQEMILVLGSFDHHRPYVFYKSFDGSLVAINIAGVRRNQKVNLQSEEIRKACFGQVPDGIGVDELQLTDEEVEFKTKLWKGVMLYGHETVSGKSVFTPQMPKRIRKIEEQDKESAV